MHVTLMSNVIAYLHTRTWHKQYKKILAITWIDRYDSQIKPNYKGNMLKNTRDHDGKTIGVFSSQETK
jgi:hypothetical protein